MPNTPVWGNDGPSQNDDQDLITVEESGSIIKVNDIDSDDEDRPAIWAINSNADGDARAIKIEGIAEFLGRSAGNDAVLKIRNCEIVTAETGDSIQLKPGSGNSSVYITPNANFVFKVMGGLHVNTGDTQLEGDFRVFGDSLFDGALQTLDMIKVGDQANGGRIDVLTVDPNQGDLKLGTIAGNTKDVEISHPTGTTKVKGGLKVYDDFNFSGDELLIYNGRIAIENEGSVEGKGAFNLNLGTSTTEAVRIGRTTKGTTVKGHLNTEEGIFVGEYDTTDGEIDANSSAGTKDLKLGTQAETQNVIIGHQDQTTIIDCNMKVGTSGAAGEIDSGGSQGTPQALKIGTGVGTSEIRIAEGQMTIMDGNLRVGRTTYHSAALCRIDAYGVDGDPADLLIGTKSDTTKLVLSREGQTTQVVGNLEVGLPGSAGAIDSSGFEDYEEDLELGCNPDVTKDVILSQTGQTTKVKGALDVDENANFDGTLAVGAAGIAGIIDSGGAALAETDLEIGGGVGTNNVLISKDGQRTDILGDARLNGNELVVNDAASLTAATGCGLEYNVLEDRIDFYVGGVVVGWVDSTGFVPA